jgi:hypothetical protein
MWVRVAGRETVRDGQELLVFAAVGALILVAAIFWHVGLLV